MQKITLTILIICEWPKRLDQPLTAQKDYFSVTDTSWCEFMSHAKTKRLIPYKFLYDLFRENKSRKNNLDEWIVRFNKV